MALQTLAPTAIPIAGIDHIHFDEASGTFREDIVRRYDKKKKTASLACQLIRIRKFLAAAMVNYRLPTGQQSGVPCCIDS
jgi:hypothetical protein